MRPTLVSRSCMVNDSSPALLMFCCVCVCVCVCVNVCVQLYYKNHWFSNSSRRTTSTLFSARSLEQTTTQQLTKGRAYYVFTNKLDSSCIYHLRPYFVVLARSHSIVGIRGLPRYSILCQTLHCLHMLRTHKLSKQLRLYAVLTVECFGPSLQEQQLAALASSLNYKFSTPCAVVPPNGQYRPSAPLTAPPKYRR